MDEAILHYRKALEISPAYPEAHYNLGDALYSQGRMAEALVHWREVLRSEPNQLVVLNRVARVLATSPDASVRNGAEAVVVRGTGCWADRGARADDPRNAGSRLRRGGPICPGC